MRKRLFDSGMVLASRTSELGVILTPIWSASLKGSYGGPSQPLSRASKTTALDFWVMTSIGSWPLLKASTDGFVQNFIAILSPGVVILNVAELS